MSYLVVSGESQVYHPNALFVNLSQKGIVFILVVEIITLTQMISGIRVSKNNLNQFLNL